MADRIKIDRKAAQAIREVNQGARRSNRVVSGIYGNIYDTINQTGSNLTAKNSRIVGQMKQLLARRAALQAAGHAQAGADAAYGGMSDFVQQSFQPAQQQAQSGSNVERAQTKEAVKSAATAQGLVDIARAGAQQAEAGSHYAVALEAAQQRHDITMAQLQQQMQLDQMDHQAELQKQQFKWQQKQAQAQLGQQEYGQAVQLGSGLTAGLGAIHDYLTDHQDASAQDVVNSLKADGVVTQGQDAVWLQLVRDIQSGKQRDDALSDVLTTFYPNLADDPKTYKRVLAYIRSQLDALDASRTAAAAHAALTPDSGGFIPGRIYGMK